MTTKIIWDDVEPCPPGCGGRHAYHARVRVERYRRGRYRVMVTDGREPFLGNWGWFCPLCQFWWRKNSTAHWCGLSRSEALILAAEIEGQWEAKMI